MTPSQCPRTKALSLLLSLSHTHTPERAWQMHCFVILGVTCSHLFLLFRKKNPTEKHFILLIIFVISPLFWGKSQFYRSLPSITTSLDDNQRVTRVTEGKSREGGMGRRRGVRNIAQDDTRTLSRCQPLMGERPLQITGRFVGEWHGRPRKRENVRRRSASNPRRAEGSDTEQSEVWKDNFPQSPATLSC